MARMGPVRFTTTFIGGLPTSVLSAGSLTLSATSMPKTVSLPDMMKPHVIMAMKNANALSPRFSVNAFFR